MTGAITEAARDQEATRVIAIRHGETDWNVDSRIQGQLDIPLNANGRWQAKQLAAAVAHEGISVLYASDLQRALQTAQAIADAAGLSAVPDRGLRERGFGVFEGLTFNEISERWPGPAARWRRHDPDFGPEYGETLHQFYTRSVDTATRLAAMHPGCTIAIVAHGGVLDCLYRAASHLPLDAPRSWRVDNASINRLLYTPQGFSLIGWGDTAHLERTPLDEIDDPLVLPPPGLGAA